MIIKLLMIFIFMSSIMFNSMKTPLSMGMMLLIQTLFITIFSGFMSLNFWYAYIMFLIMIGGMMILFIYISSISSNLKFFFNKKFFTMSVIIFFLVIIFSFMKLKMTLFYGPNIFNMMEIEIEHNYFLKMSLNKLYNKPTNKIMILMINYLLMMLFIVVKITNINLGPFRKSN